MVNNLTNLAPYLTNISHSSTGRMKGAQQWSQVVEIASPESKHPSRVDMLRKPIQTVDWGKILGIHELCCPVHVEFDALDRR